MLKAIFLILFLSSEMAFAYGADAQAVDFANHIKIFMDCRSSMRDEMRKELGASGIASADMIINKMNICLDHSSRSHVSSNSVMKECLRRLSSLEAQRKQYYAPKIDLNYYTTYIKNCNDNPFGQIPVPETIEF